LNGSGFDFLTLPVFRDDVVERRVALGPPAHQHQRVGDVRHVLLHARGIVGVGEVETDLRFHLVGNAGAALVATRWRTFPKMVRSTTAANTAKTILRSFMFPGV
jgi:hypothetical protein